MMVGPAARSRLKVSPDRAELRCFRCEHPDEVRPAIQAMLASPRPALLEAVVDANEPPLKPNQLRA
jgi:thiamine pyrophosphate-dependent acetolactate synthase large subunit-like protein